MEKWKRSGTEVEQEWRRAREVEQKWNRSGTKVEQKWNRSGTEAEQKWNRSGTEVEQKWKISPGFAAGSAGPILLLFCYSFAGGKCFHVLPRNLPGGLARGIGQEKLGFGRISEKEC